jgi:putative nucleotidyltransferase with HDIG domain
MVQQSRYPLCDLMLAESVENVRTPNNIQASVSCSEPSDRAEKMIELIGALPAMPHIAAQVMQTLARSDATPREIQELIAKDQSLTGQVLQVANSPYYGASRSISTIKEAIIFMGFDSISSLITTAVVKDMFSRVSNEGAQLWEHSICCATAAKHLGGALGVQNLDTAFLVGLLHDIGKSVLFLQVPEKMRDIVLSVNGGESFIETERERLGFTHAQVGQSLAQKWRLTLTMEEVIANHHEPECSKNAGELTHIVSIANSLCHKLSIGLTKRPAIDPYKLESVKVLGLGTAVIASTLDLLSKTLD